MSKTPRVDHAERLIYNNSQEPVGYVLSSVAKRLEIELNQALADLKAAQRLLKADSSSPHPGQIEPVERPVAEKQSDESAPIAWQAAAPTPPPSGKSLQGRVSQPSQANEAASAPAHVIQPPPNLQSAGESVEYEDGQVLFNKGDNAKHLAIILEGSVEVFDPVGNVRLAMLGAGCSFGEQAILEGGVRDASVRASGKVKCLEIKTKALRAQLMKDKGLLLQTIEGLLLQLSMCNQISKMIATPDTDLVYELVKDERLTTLQIQSKLHDAFNHPDSHGLPAEQMMYLKLQSSEKLMSHWFESGTVLGRPSGDAIGSAYVIMEGSVEAQCGHRTLLLGCGSVLGLAEGVTAEPFSWTLVAKAHLTVKIISIDKVLRDLEHSNPGVRGIVRYSASRILELQKNFGT